MKILASICDTLTWVMTLGSAILPMRMGGQPPTLTPASLSSPAPPMSSSSSSSSSSSLCSTKNKWHKDNQTTITGIGKLLSVRVEKQKTTQALNVISASKFEHVKLIVFLSFCLSFLLSFFLSFFLTFFPSVFHSVFLSVCLSFCLSFRLSFFPSVILFVFPSFFPSVFLSFYSSIDLSIYICIYVSVHLFICLCPIYLYHFFSLFGQRSWRGQCPLLFHTDRVPLFFSLFLSLSCFRGS